MLAFSPFRFPEIPRRPPKARRRTRRRKRPAAFLARRRKRRISFQILDSLDCSLDLDIRLLPGLSRHLVATEDNSALERFIWRAIGEF